jgi:hypothetical protein
MHFNCPFFFSNFWTSPSIFSLRCARWIASQEKRPKLSHWRTHGIVVVKFKRRQRKLVKMHVNTQYHRICCTIGGNYGNHTIVFDILWYHLMFYYVYTCMSFVGPLIWTNKILLYTISLFKFTMNLLLINCVFIVNVIYPMS